MSAEQWVECGWCAQSFPESMMITQRNRHQCRHCKDEIKQGLRNPNNLASAGEDGEDVARREALNENAS